MKKFTEENPTFEEVFQHLEETFYSNRKLLIVLAILLTITKFL